MILPIILCLLCISTVRSDSSMSIKEVSVEKMPMMDALATKEKRYLNHHQGIPCPPTLHSHSPAVTLVKPIVKPIIPAISYHMPTYVHQPIKQWQPMQHQIWQPPQHQAWKPMWQPNLWQPKQQIWQPNLWQPKQQIWQPKVVVQKPVFSYAPMYHHQPVHQNLVKIQQPQWQKPVVLLKPCYPMPMCKPSIPSYHYPKSEIKYVQPQQHLSYIKVPQHQPIVHQPYLSHVPLLSHGVKEICTK